MSIVKPFKATYYNLKKVKTLKNVVCPPYDVINKEYEKALQKRSKYNYVNMTLKKPDLSYKELSKELSEDTYRAELRQYTLTLHIDYRFDAFKVVKPFIGIFLGGASLQAQGNTSTSMRATETHTLTAAAGIQAGIAFETSRNVSLVTRVAAGAFFPPVEVMFGPESAAMCGPLYINVGLALQVHF